MLAADLVAQAALHLGIVVVHVVELQLHKFQLRPVGQDLIQHLGAVVEGYTHMAQLALRLQLLGDVIGAGVLIFPVALGAHGVHQVEVKVFHAAGFQLVFNQGADVRFGFK